MSKFFSLNEAAVPRGILLQYGQIWDRAGEKKDQIFLCAIHLCAMRIKRVQLCIYFEIHLEMIIFRGAQPSASKS
jgi:hypothetical protein